MTLWDDRILEYVRANEGASVGEIAEQEGIRISRPHVSRRCQKLAEHRLLRPLGNGVYVITERGEGYLDEEISTYENEPDEIPDDEMADDENGVQSPGSI
jgi:DNA-binding Lrp family transcriptional regulator